MSDKPPSRAIAEKVIAQLQKESPRMRAIVYVMMPDDTNTCGVLGFDKQLAVEILREQANVIEQELEAESAS